MDQLSSGLVNFDVGDDQNLWKVGVWIVECFKYVIDVFGGFFCIDQWCVEWCEVVGLDLDDW